MGSVVAGPVRPRIRFGGETNDPFQNLSKCFDLSHEKVYDRCMTPTATPLYSVGSVRPGTWDDSSWRADAACLHVDTETFFPLGLTGEALDQVDRAKRICASCPVREFCLEFALRTNQDHGVWGGHTEEERRTLRRARRAAQRRAAVKAS